METLSIAVGIAGLIVGIACLIWMVRNWLDKRFKRLHGKLKKHDKSDKKLKKAVRELGGRVESVEEGLLALNGKMDTLLEKVA